MLQVAGEVITWLFAPGSYAPMARLTAAGGHAIVTDQVGAPLLVADAAGDVKAQFVTDSRGRARVVGDATLCPWRFAGQYRDEETGLHYNRMRYYDPDAGQYISRDPLGLRAGLRVYGYVGDPGIASDPLGLSPQAGGGCGGAFRGGRHGDTRGPAGDGLKSHHMPADSVSPLPTREGPAIQMEPADHRRTGSHGSQGAAGVAHRARQASLIADGRFDDAIQMDIDDIQSKLGSKYDEAILEMIGSL